MAFLELLSNGKRFRVAEHDVSMISNILVPDVNTIVLDYPSIGIKHAVITNIRHRVYQITDIFSGTSIKAKGDLSFEPLEPLKSIDLLHGDIIRLSHQISATFHIPEQDEVVESSQVSGTYHSLEPARSKDSSRFFVPATEKMDFGNVSSGNDSINQSIEIPQTQEEPLAPFKRSRLNSSATNISSGTALEMVSNVDERSRDGFLISQDIFGDVSANKSHQLAEDDDDGLMSDVEMPIKRMNVDPREGSVTPDLEFESGRDGSLTPELNFSSESKPKSQQQVLQADIATQLNFTGFGNTPPPLQADISTQLNIDDSEAKLASWRRLLQADIATQLNIEDSSEEDNINKETTLQCNIETQIADDTEDFEYQNEPMMQPTQPMFMFGSRTRLHTKRQAELKPKTASLSVFDDTQQIEDVPSSSKKLKRCFVTETQPIFAESQESQELFKKPKATNRILMSSSEESEDDFESYSSAVAPNQEKNCHKTAIIVDSPKTPDSPTLLSDNDTPDFLPKFPSHSQLPSFLDIVNASQPANETAVTFDPSLEDDETFSPNKRAKKQQNKPELKRKTRRNLMKFACESDDDDTPSTSAKVQNQVKGENKKPIEASKSAEKLTKTAEVVKKDSKTAEKKEGKAKLVDLKIFYNIAITNINDNKLKDKLQNACEKLGSTIVDHVKDADLLLTNDKMKLTAKFLASICKGIPIVSEDFIEASRKARKWLDPYDFIIVDREMETKKNMSLKAVILKAKSQKFLQNYSVFVTKNTLIPYEELKEIIESAGAECIQGSRHTAKNENVALIYSPKETGQFKSITKKYPNIAQIRDSHICVTVLRQEL